MTDLTNLETEDNHETDVSVTVHEFLRTVGRLPTSPEEFWCFGQLVADSAGSLIKEAWPTILKSAADELNPAEADEGKEAFTKNLTMYATATNGLGVRYRINRWDETHYVVDRCTPDDSEHDIEEIIHGDDDGLFKTADDARRWAIADAHTVVKGITK